MLKDAALFLALTENAGYFEWTYPALEQPVTEANRYYVEDIVRIFGITDLKAFAESEEALLKLVTLLENSEW